MKDIDTLESELRDHWKEWLVFPPVRQKFDRAAVRKAVNEFYDRECLPAPILVFCASPWQMIMTKAVLQYGLTPSRMRPLRGQLDRGKSVRRWKDLYANLYSQLDDQQIATLAEEFRQYAGCIPRPWQTAYEVEFEEVWTDGLWREAREWLTFRPERGHTVDSIFRSLRAAYCSCPFSNNAGLDPLLRVVMLEDAFDELTDRKDDEPIREFYGYFFQNPLGVDSEDFDDLLNCPRNELDFARYLLFSGFQILSGPAAVGCLPFWDYIDQLKVFSWVRGGFIKALLNLLATSHFIMLHDGICFVCAELDALPKVHRDGVTLHLRRVV